MNDHRYKQMIEYKCNGSVDWCELNISNTTCYETSDIASLVKSILEQTQERPSEIHLSVRYQDYLSDYFAASAPDMSKASRRRSRWRGSREERTGVVYLARKGYFEQDSAMGFMALADKVVLPDSVRQLADVLHRVLGFGVGQSTGWHNIYTPKDVWANLPDVRIGSNPKATKRTKEDKAKHALGQYGLGSKMHGSSRTYAGYWAYRISTACYYYQKEYNRREAWREKAESHGAVVPDDQKHETFPQYLRRMADEFESKEKK